MKKKSLFHIPVDETDSGNRLFTQGFKYLLLNLAGFRAATDIPANPSQAPLLLRKYQPETVSLGFIMTGKRRSIELREEKIKRLSYNTSIENCGSEQQLLRTQRLDCLNGELRD